MEKSHQTPFSAKLKKLPPKKPKNIDCRTREYLTHIEIDKLRKAAKAQGRHGHRDLMYPHEFTIRVPAHFE